MTTVDTLFDNHLIWKAEDAREDTCIPSFPDLFQTGRVHEIFSDSLGKMRELHAPVALPILISKELWDSRIEKKVFVFIGKECFPTPFFLSDCFSSTKVNFFKNFIFVDASTSKEKLWAIETALSSTSVACVLADVSELSFQSSRRLSLLAQKNGALCFLFRKHQKRLESSAAFARWQFATAKSGDTNPAWTVTLLHTKGTKLLKNSWKVGLNYEKKISLNIFPELGNQFSTGETFPRYGT